jgi:DNA invertase Pin-like site-specific DNA recombinase
LEAQQASTSNFCRAESREVVATYQDIASGACADRPGLTEAIDHARRLRCPLVVARLDRLSRDLAHSALVMKRVQVMAVDLGGIEDRLVMQIMGAVAERERELISERTKAALAAKKARGEPVGSSRAVMIELAKRGHATQQAQRQAFAESNRAAFGIVEGLSHRAAARQLNELRVPAMNGGPWCHQSGKGSPQPD